MSEFKIVMPKMGESVQEATITKLFVKVGDNIEEDQLLFEIATEKVDSEIPSPVEGKISAILCQVGDLIAVGKVVMVIELDGKLSETIENDTKITVKSDTPAVDDTTAKVNPESYNSSSRFYSPLVKSIAAKENITLNELELIEGHGLKNRVQKNDLLNYIQSKAEAPNLIVPSAFTTNNQNNEPTQPKIAILSSPGDTIVEMDRVRKIIADHMVNSVRISPHVTSVVEADVTNIVLWREKVKNDYQQKHNLKLTYMPIFIEAVAKALRQYPMVNSSVDGTNIILRKHVNIGIAVAKPDGNLIVPVIADADQKNLLGITQSMNDLAYRARTNKLSPDEIQGGTFSITNFGTFRNLIGTPIINQPQVAILATGSIEKKPAVMETPTGDAIVVRHKMYLSLSYDHRVIDGALGGAFLRRIADLLEGFDSNQII